jgi:hypothetical protein
MAAPLPKVERPRRLSLGFRDGRSPVLEQEVLKPEHGQDEANRLHEKGWMCGVATTERPTGCEVDTTAQTHGTRSACLSAGRQAESRKSKVSSLHEPGNDHRASRRGRLRKRRT